MKHLIYNTFKDFYVMKKVKRLIKSLSVENEKFVFSELMKMGIEIFPVLMHELTMEKNPYKRKIYYSALLNFKNEIVKVCLDIIQKNMNTPKKSNLAKVATNVLQMHYMDEFKRK